MERQGIVHVKVYVQHVILDFLTIILSCSDSFGIPVRDEATTCEQLFPLPSVMASPCRLQSFFYDGTKHNVMV